MPSFALIHAQSPIRPGLSPSIPRNAPSNGYLGSPQRKRFALSLRSIEGCWCLMNLERRNCRKKAISVYSDLNSSNDSPPDEYMKKRNIVEHILLLRAKPDLSDAEEKDMLDYLYTSQYQMGGILSISLGRLEEPRHSGFSHAVFMRFQKKEDVVKFYSNSYYSSIIKDHVTPYCIGLISVDYESEVDDDILPIFRRGEEFNYGVECLLLVSFSETAQKHQVENAFATLQNVIRQFRSCIVQATQGCNLNLSDSEYTHAAVIRFPSFENYKIFSESLDFKDMWRSKFQPVMSKSLIVHFVVDPVGTELM